MLASHLLAHKLVRAVMTQWAFLRHVLSHQLNFKVALQLVHAFAENLRHAPRGRLAVCRACRSLEFREYGCLTEQIASSREPSNDAPNPHPS
jgi:hypothetical protein